MKSAQATVVAALFAAWSHVFLTAQTPPPPESTPANARPPATQPLAGTIREVTLYQGTALVSRQVEIPDGLQGSLELVVGPLPTTTQPQSVYADLVKGAVVRSVACRSHPLDEKAKMLTRAQEVAKDIRALKARMAVNRNEIALRRIRQEYLRDLQKFVAPAAAQEMTHGVLQSKELEAVTQMHFREYETASQEIMKVDLELTEQQELLAKLNEEAEKLAAGPDITYDAVIYLDKPAAGPAELSLNYLVGDCGWTPVYNVRGDSAKKGVEFEFNALIHQVSGEDWGNVKVALSTASPKTSAYNPMLAPLYVSMGTDARQQGSATADTYRNAIQTKNDAMESQYRAKSLSDVANANFRANDIAASVQLIELSESFGELRAFSEGARDELSIRYEIGGPVTLVSRRDAQMVPVLRHTAAASFYHVCVPTLTPAVFREAEIVNSGGHDLLGGSVNVFLNGEFKGRTDVPTIARGRSFTLGFGVDGQIKARRTLTDRRDDVQGGNRMISLTPEIHVENFGTEPVNLQLRERVPFMDDGTKLRVSPGEMSHPLCKDDDYLRYERSKGILRWDLTVPPGIGAKGTTLRYGYTLEFDKNLSLRDIGQELKARAQKEFIDRSMAPSQRAVPKAEK